ncbi:MAG TPA: penicillin acylase family protein, partial [Deinococcales bacterium]|nr:penicillin acylase family protein [Deinococcales bacterium]
MKMSSVLSRALLWLTAALLFLAVTGFLILRTSLPVTEGSLELAGLAAPVTVTRDADGIPHISAGSAEDAYRALGFVHAQDRLWQLEFQRLVAAGRLSEAVGEAGLSTDRFLRTLGVYRAAESAWDNLTDREARRWISAYADGVNAFLESRRGVLPPEFLLLNHRPEPYRPEDVLAWAKMMAWDLAGNWNSELLRARLLQRLPAREVDRLFPDWPGDVPVTLGDYPPDDGAAPGPPDGEPAEDADPDTEAAAALE